MIPGLIAPGGILPPGHPPVPHHPFADIFPMLAEGRRPSFRASLEASQNRPIVLHKGKVLDGRNRLRELDELKKPVDFVIFTGTNKQALDFVVAENLERRDLTDKDRARIAAQIATLRLGDNQHTRVTAPPIGGGSEPALFAGAQEEGAPKPDISHAEAAALMHVPLRSVERAAVIEKSGAPELKEAVATGPISLATGAEIARLPIDEQKKILASADPKAVKEIAKNNRAEKQKATRERRLANMARPDATPLLTGLRTAGVLYVDIPRRFVTWSSETGAEKSPENHYRVETFEYLAGLRDQIQALAKPNCVLYMWGWACSLLDQIDLMAEWGFASLRRRGDDGRLLRGPDGRILPPVGEGRYRTHQIWAKREPSTGKYHRGMGFWFIDCHELLLVGARGDVPAPIPGTQPFSILDLPIGENSQKPDDIRDQIDRTFPGVPKTELFARPLDRARWPDWEFWGNEFADAPAAAELKLEAAE
jgi:N6-adenosine-specific RNA methylase IME4